MKEGNFQLVGKPKMNKFNFEANQEFVIGEDVSLEVNNNVQIIREIDSSSNQALVILMLDVFKKRAFDEVPFTISLEIEGLFMWSEEINDETIDIFLKQNAPAILFSYTRPLITLITVEANMPPLIMPVMNFQD